MKFVDYTLVGICIIILLLIFIRKTIQSWLLKQKFKIAKKKEKAAIAFLKKKGYRIIDIQKKVPFITKVDGKEYKNYVQVDMIVKKNGKEYIAEVKTGSRATKATNRRTRRQLLEYFYVYKPDGVLLIDMDKKRIKEVEFEIIKPSLERTNVFFSQLLVFLFGILTGFIIFKGMIK